MRGLLLCGAAMLWTACATRLLAPEGGTSADLGAADGGAPSLDALARVCALATSCSPAGSLEASQCVSNLIGGWTSDPVGMRLSGCAGAYDCASLVACFGGDLFLTRSVASGTCEASAIVAGSRRFDCQLVGLNCVHEMPGSRVHCATQPCVGNAPVCVGGVIQACVAGVPTSVDCSAEGRVCAGSECVGAGASCNPMGTAGSCSGSVATNCLGGTMDVRDCALDPWKTDCSSGMCVFPASSVNCLVGNSMCMGSSLILCAGDGGGVWKSVDCRSIGFTSCGGSPAACQ